MIPLTVIMVILSLWGLTEKMQKVTPTADISASTVVNMNASVNSPELAKTAGFVERSFLSMFFVSFQIMLVIKLDWSQPDRNLRETWP